GSAGAGRFGGPGRDRVQGHASGLLVGTARPSRLRCRWNFPLPFHYSTGAAKSGRRATRSVHGRELAFTHLVPVAPAAGAVVHAHEQHGLVARLPPGTVVLPL